MLALDVNILVSAFRADATDHVQLREWLEDAVGAPEPVGVSDAVLGATVRIITNPRVFRSPTPIEVALAQTGGLRRQDGVVTLVPGARHWELFDALCRRAGARGNIVADAQHAALALEHGATWISKDRDFARFAGLAWRHPFDLA